MVHAPRLVLLRLTSMAAVCVSALLTYDSLHPERAFCPLAEACEMARDSALGSIGGIPTSVIGMGAFGLLFLLTLLPVEFARPLLRPGGLVAAIAGAGLFAYQAVVLPEFCPLCLIADGAGLLAGLITLTWPRLPRRRSGKRLPGESGSSRLAWTFAMLLAVAVPFAWPRAVRPAWEEVPSTENLFEGEDAPPAPRPGPRPAPPGPAPRPAPGPTVTPTPPPFVPSPRPETEPPAPTPEPEPPPTDPVLEPAAPVPAPIEPPPPEPPATPPPGSEPEPGSTPAGPEPAPPATPSPSASAPAPLSTSAARPQVKIVEYINAYCAHCRITHKRLHAVLAGLDVEVRFRRVYTWSSNDFPLWARALAFAQSVGREDRLFEELLVAKGQGAPDVYAAAQRAGLDVGALQRALQDTTPPLRLVRDRDLAQKSGLRGLPTLDIGRRRLMGEQSEAELREAVQAALPGR